MICCCGGDWTAVAVDEVLSIFFLKAGRAAQLFENAECSINSLLSRFAAQVLQMFASDLGQRHAFRHANFLAQPDARIST